MTAQSLKNRGAKRLKATGQPQRRKADRCSKPFRSKPKPEGYVLGRPTLYRPEYCQLAIERMGKGLSLTAFAGTIGVSKHADYEWTRVHADFDDAMSRARPARTLWLEQKLLRSRKGAETTAAIFALRNAAPDEWHDIKHTTHDHNVRVEQLSDDQLMAIAARARTPALIETKPVEAATDVTNTPALGLAAAHRDR